MKTKLPASPDSSGILFPAPLAGKRYSGWQERHLLKKPKISASKKLIEKLAKDFDFALSDIRNLRIFATQNL